MNSRKIARKGIRMRSRKLPIVDRNVRTNRMDRHVSNACDHVRLSVRGEPWPITFHFDPVGSLHVDRKSNERTRARKRTRNEAKSHRRRRREWKAFVRKRKGWTTFHPRHFLRASCTLVSWFHPRCLFLRNESSSPPSAYALSIPRQTDRHVRERNPSCFFSLFLHHEMQTCRSQPRSRLSPIRSTDLMDGRTDGIMDEMGVSDASGENLAVGNRIQRCKTKRRKAR